MGHLQDSHEQSMTKGDAPFDIKEAVTCLDAMFEDGGSDGTYR